MDFYFNLVNTNINAMQQKPILQKTYAKNCGFCRKKPNAHKKSKTLFRKRYDKPKTHGSVAVLACLNFADGNFA